MNRWGGSRWHREKEQHDDCIGYDSASHDINDQDQHKSAKPEDDAMDIDAPSSSKSAAASSTLESDAALAQRLSAKLSPDAEYLAAAAG